ncbi:MAG TPA: DUF6559 family protein [Candidatus Polarisedimenticolia bacterium]|nr:DUF6559 family protein [Candidatus Polarisedimenticolia bacterium]
MAAKRHGNRWGWLRRIKRTNEIKGVILGVLLIIAGVLFVAFPKAAAIPHQDSEDGNFISRISKQDCQTYGIVEIILGAGFIWAFRWPGWGARRSAIDDYFWNLSRELARHFGERRYYDIDHVSQTARDFDCDMAYIAYAHAMFCSREDFDAYYRPLRVRCTYDGLRAVVIRRYLDGVYWFNAASIVRHAAPPLFNGEHCFSDNV